MRPLMLLLILLLPLALTVSAQETAAITRETAPDLALSRVLSGHDATVNDLAFSADSLTLVSGASDITARLWSLPDGETTAEFNGQLTEVRSVDITADGETVLTTGFNGVAFLWDVRSETRATSYNADEYPALSDGVFSADGTAITLAMGDGAIRQYDIETSELLMTLLPPAPLTERIAYNADESELAAGVGFPADTAVVFDVATETLTHTLEGHVGTVYAVAYAPDGALLATGDSAGTIRLWDATDDYALVAEIPAHDGEVFDVAFNTDGSLLASVGFDGVTRVWDVATGAELVALTATDEVRSVNAVTFSADDMTLASAGEAGDIWLWQIP
jgi:WD40 repeat protein